RPCFSPRPRAHRTATRARPKARGHSGVSPSENSGDGSGELAPHESFLMATRYHPRLNWHTLATWEPVDGSSIEAVRAEIQSGIANPAPPRNPGAPELPVPAATAGAVDPAQPRAVIPSGAEVSDTPGGGDGP